MTQLNQRQRDAIRNMQNELDSDQYDEFSAVTIRRAARKLLAAFDGPANEGYECNSCEGPLDKDGNCLAECNGGYPSLTNGGYE